MTACVIRYCGVNVPPSAQEYDSDEFQVWLASLELGPRLLPAPKSERAIRTAQTLSVDWTVTCLEDLCTYAVHAVEAATCPQCGTGLIRAWRGKPTVVYADPGGAAFEAWLRSRFVSGFWEPPLRQGGEVRLPPVSVITLDDNESAVVEAISGSDWLQDLLAALAREKALLVLDAILVARVHWTPEHRQSARIESATFYFQSGGLTENISLAELPAPDIFDAAGPLGPKVAAGIALEAIG